MKKKSNKGFTIIELVVVIAIIGILAGVTTATVVSQVSKAKNMKDTVNAADATTIINLAASGTAKEINPSGSYANGFGKNDNTLDSILSVIYGSDKNISLIPSNERYVYILDYNEEKMKVHAIDTKVWEFSSSFNASDSRYPQYVTVGDIDTKNEFVRTKSVVTQCTYIKGDDKIVGYNITGHKLDEIETNYNDKKAGVYGFNYTIANGKEIYESITSYKDPKNYISSEVEYASNKKELVKVKEVAKVDNAEMILENTITTIAENCFEDSTLEAIHIPSSVKSIGTEVFKNVENLNSIYFSGTMDAWTSMLTTNDCKNWANESQKLKKISCSNGIIGLSDTNYNHF